jgi:hypothetical protein
MTKDKMGISPSTVGRLAVHYNQKVLETMLRPILEAEAEGLKFKTTIGCIASSRPGWAVW